MKRVLLLALNVVLLMMTITPSIAAATPPGVGKDTTVAAEVQKLSESQDFDTQLSSGSTNEDVLWLWDILVENYGNKVISGHNIDNSEINYFKEMRYFKETIGTMPASMVFEMYDYDQAAVDNGVSGEAVDRAIAWSKVNGGIVGFHWHWHIDQQYTKAGKQWWQTTYVDDLDSSRFGAAFTEAMTTKSGDLYDYIINDIDLIAEQLKILKEHNVPVLWRPLHEASGTWFWWGGYGAENFKELWKLMYDRLTNDHDLDNLIWVWNSHGNDWFPGEEYVDMASTDVGADNYVYESYADRYTMFVNDFQDLGIKKKMLALTETGPIPDIDKMQNDGAMWSFWATWVGTPFTGTTPEKMRDTLNDSRVISLDELPPQPNPRPDVKPIPIPDRIPDQDPPPPEPENYEEWIWWTGSAKTLGPDPGMWRLGIGETTTPWNSVLGPFYRPNAIEPGYVMNVTFKYDSAQGDPSNNLFIEPAGGGTEKKRLYPKQIIDAEKDGYRIASFLLYDFVQDMTVTNEVFISDTSSNESNRTFEITKITLSNRMPNLGESKMPVVYKENVWFAPDAPIVSDGNVVTLGSDGGDFTGGIFKPEDIKRNDVLNVTFKSEAVPFIPITLEGSDEPLNLIPYVVTEADAQGYRVVSYYLDSYHGLTDIKEISFDNNGTEISYAKITLANRPLLPGDDDVDPTDPTDTEAPTWKEKSEVTVNGTSSSSVSLKWTEAEDNIGVTGYQVIWTVGNTKKSTDVAGNVTSVTISGLQSDTSYSFKVEAVDAAGNLSETGPGVTVKTHIQYTPTPPVVPQPNPTPEPEQPAEPEQPIEPEQPTEPEQPNETEQPKAEFTDVPVTHWAATAIHRAAALGIVKGYPDNSFKPNATTSRAEFMMMLANALKWQDEKQEKAEQTELSFTDNDKIGAWAMDVIAQGIERRVITGYTDGSFRPHQEITRTEMIVMLVRALGMTPAELEQTGFADDAAIPIWGKGEVEALRELGLVTGRSNNSFAPQEAATRAEALVIIMRILDSNLNHQ